MLRQVLSVGGLTLASRVLGFLRDVLMAAILGAGPVADAFILAFRLPNHFRALFAEGAVNSAFVPVFSATMVRSGRRAALALAERVLSILVLSQLLLLVLALAAMPWIVELMEGSRDPETTELKVLLTRITFPFLLFISIVALQGAALNAMNRFAAAAAAPIAMNLVLIGTMLFVVPLMPTAGHALAWGVFAAGIAQLLLLSWQMRRERASLQLVMPRLTPGVRAFLRALGPAVLGAGVVQISLFADTVIAQSLPQGAQSYLYYADRLNQLPLGVIGIAVGTVLLPALSRTVESGDEAAARNQLGQAILLSLAMALPFVAGFLAAARPIVSVLFERGAFDAVAAQESAETLAAYALGLPAFIVLRSLVSAFYARQDTRTPMIIATIAITANVALKILLMHPFEHVGLAIATSAGAWLNVALLTALLHRRGHIALEAALMRRLAGLAAATAIMAVIFGGGAAAFGPWRSGLADFARLAGIALIGVAAYGATAVVTGAVDRGAVAAVLRRRR